MRLLDVGSGSADVPLRLSRLAERSNLKLDVTAADISSRALSLAADRARQLNAPLKTLRIDVLHEALPREFDIVTCSLFLHHLTDDQAASLLRKMASSSRRLLLVSDLVRKNWGLVLAKLATPCLPVRRWPVSMVNAACAPRSRSTKPATSQPERV